MVTSEDVRERSLQSRHNKFFDPDTMRWWKSRLLSEVFDLEDGRVLFMTSDDPFDSGRLYTVRVIDGEGYISTVAERLADRKTASRVLQFVGRSVRYDGATRALDALADDLLTVLGTGPVDPA